MRNTASKSMQPLRRVYRHTYAQCDIDGCSPQHIAPHIYPWLLARQSYHFGASGLTHGIMFFIFTIGILRRDRLSIALAMIVFFVYGGMIWSIFPQEPGISYESHFFGAMIGVLAAFLFRDHDPSLPAKEYQWENEDPEDENGTNVRGE